MGIYKGDMNKLETKIENVETNVNSKIDKVETSLKSELKSGIEKVLELLRPLSDDLLVRNARKKK